MRDNLEIVFGAHPNRPCPRSGTRRASHVRGTNTVFGEKNKRKFHPVPFARNALCVCASINNVNDERRRGEKKKRRSFFIVKVIRVGVRGSGQVKKRGREIGAGRVLSRKINYRPSVWPLTPYVSIVDPALVVFPRTVLVAHAFALCLPVVFFYDSRRTSIPENHGRILYSPYTTAIIE